MKAFSTRHGRWTAALITGLLVVGLGAIGQADAGEVVDGNPTCEGYDHSAKFENASGIYTIDRDGLHLTLTVGTYPDVSEPNQDNAVVSFLVHEDSDVTRGQIIVKGSSGAIVYQFGEVVPLHSPTLENGKWPSISHVQICWDEPQQPELARIELTKAVTGDDAPTDTDFELCITGPAPDDTQQCRTVGNGETAVFIDLQPGTYTVTETDPGDDWTVTYSDDTLTISAGQTGTATVTNTWETEEPELARIELTKAVTGDDAPTDTDFELCITGPAPDDTQQCRTVGNGETAVFIDLQPGTYTVTETDPGDDWTVTYSDDTLTISASQTGTATVTNTWETEEQEPPIVPARIELTKAVTGDGAPPATVFTLCITGPAVDDTPQCRMVSAGQTAVFTNLEPGTYTVTETDPGDDWTVSYSDETLTVGAGDTGTATVTNTWEEQGQLPPAPTPPAPTPPTVVSPSGGSLPTTGIDLSIAQAAIATGLLAIGSVLLRMSRRPESTTS